MGEADLPAQHKEASPQARVPAAHVHARGSRRPQGSPAQGSPPAVGLTWAIRDRTTFARLRASGSRTRSGVITVTYLADGFPGPPRVAFSVGRRVGGAVIRNRVRRRLRSVVAEAAPGLAGGAYLISASAGATAVTYDQLRGMVRTALEPMRADVPAPRAGQR
jgi:ribonuclease P protein component